MNLTKKQQIQVVCIVLVVLMLIWQLYKLFSNSPSDTVSVHSGVSANQVSQSPRLSSMPPAQEIATKRSASVLPPASAGELEYARLANEYQLIQMQRMIAESYEAIAVAKRNTAKAIAETSQYLGNTGSTMPVAANELGSATRSNEYELIYTGQEGGQWTATLKKNNQTFDVVPNTVLGNMKITSIDDNGVTVMQGDTKKVITFNGIQAGNVNPVLTSDTVKDAAKSNMPKPVTSSLVLPSPPVMQPVKTPVAAATLPVANQAAQPATSIVVPKAPMKSTVSTPIVTPQYSQKGVEKPAALAGVQQPAPPLQANPIKKPTAPIVTTEENQEIFKLDSKHYTVQLMADTDINSLKQFIVKNKLQDKALLVKIKKNNKNWYLLIYGDYASYVAANDALDGLPESILGADPFVRKVSNIQSVAKQAIGQ